MRSRNSNSVANLPEEASKGFSLIELLVVIAIIAILSALLLPGIGKVKQRSQSIQCMNNHRQLMLAWNMYTDDNRGNLLFASYSAYPSLQAASAPYVWVLGQMDFDTTNPSNWDPDEDIKKSPIWRYGANNTAIWKCPSDSSVIVPSTGKFAGKTTPRVRSISMNLWVGGFAGEYPWDTRWKVYTKLSMITDPGPSGTWVLMDQREDCVNLGNFLTVMDGFDPKNPALYSFCEDIPASYHHLAGGLSFVDGHAEIKRWEDPRTMPPLVKDFARTTWTRSPNNRDIEWLQQRSTRRVDQ